MSFRSETFRVLIASPSDLREERRVAADAIADWNAEHALAEGVVLLPVMWETHAMPQAAARPQEAINQQIVCESDILVGMFWTKLGTHTGIAESGTVEEIDQFSAAGKPTLLYFSRRPIDPDSIDLQQFGRMREFKEATYKTALTGAFTSLDELRSVLVRHLTQQVRKLAPRKASRSNRLDDAFRITDLIKQHRESTSPRRSLSDTAMSCWRRTAAPKLRQPIPRRRAR